MSVNSISWDAWVQERVSPSCVDELRLLFEVAERPAHTFEWFFHFVGPSASGKSTAADVLANYFGRNEVGGIQPMQLAREVRGLGFSRRLIIVDGVSNRLREWHRLGNLIQKEAFNPWRLTPEEIAEHDGFPMDGALLVISQGGREVETILDRKERRIEFSAQIKAEDRRPRMAEQLAADHAGISNWIHNLKGAAE